MALRLSWKAFYYDGESARRHDASIELTPHALILIIEKGNGGGGRERLSWDYSEITQSQGFHEGEPVRLERGDEALVIKEGGFVLSLSEIAPLFSPRFSSPEGKGRNLVWIPVLTALTAVIGLSAYFWAIPRVASIAAGSVPASVEERLGASFVSELGAVYKECAAEAAQGPIDRIVGTLSSALPDNPYRFKVHIFKNSSINAFAAPGGHIVVLTGLIEASKTPEELAGVIAHEMQHILKRHATKRMFEEMSAGVLFSFIFGDAKGASGALRAAGGLRYSRMLEEEADRGGAELLVNAGVNPEGMISFFENLRRGGDGAGDMEFLRYISTHPLTKERIEYIRAHIEGMPEESVPLLSDVDWEAVRRAC